MTSCKKNFAYFYLYLCVPDTDLRSTVVDSKSFLRQGEQGYEAIAQFELLPRLDLVLYSLVHQSAEPRPSREGISAGDSKVGEWERSLTIDKLQQEREQGIRFLATILTLLASGE